jgi:hypothetical protein
MEGCPERLSQKDILIFSRKFTSSRKEAQGAVVCSYTATTLSVVDGPMERREKGYQKEGKALPVGRPWRSRSWLRSEE